MDNQNKNLILAVVLSGIVLLAWTYFFPPAEQPAITAPSEVTTQAGDLPTPSASDATTSTTAPETPTTAAADAGRVEIDSARLIGSISLQGGRVDDVSLKDYTVSLDSDELVTLLSPVGSANAYYTVYGWTPGGDLQAADVPNSNTIWSVESGETLSTDTPVGLVWDNGNGLVFHREFSIDDEYLLTVSQSVENNTGAAVRLAPYGIIARHGLPDTKSYAVLHEGLVRLDDEELEEVKYKKMDNFPEANGVYTEEYAVTQNGWTGFTDKNWMTTLIPMPGQAFKSIATFAPAADLYTAQTILPTMDVAAGETAGVTTMLFAGAKEWEAIKHYQNDVGISRFVDSIDWGMFFFFTKPIFRLLHALNALIGNMGWSIIVLTLIIKGIMFPLAYKSYVSMARMKELQPEMEKLKEAAGDDKQKMQQGMMELYRKNKVNPASGCLPLILQIPVFFSLYKVIFVTIELRQAPWLGWIRDLSAPDPTSILNLFGLLPFAAPGPESMLAIISIGILPILLGLSMWLQQRLNPAPADPAQQMIFMWMPWVFMFMLGSFASGLVLYWITNNTITFTQQYLIMRSHGHKPDVLGNILRTLRLKKKEAAAK